MKPTDVILTPGEQDQFKGLFTSALKTYNSSNNSIDEKTMDIPIVFLHFRLIFMHFLHIAIDKSTETNIYSDAFKFILQTMNQAIQQKAIKEVKKLKKPEEEQEERLKKSKAIRYAFLRYFIDHSYTKSELPNYPGLDINGQGLINFRFYFLFLLTLPRLVPGISISKEEEERDNIHAVFDIQDILTIMDNCFKPEINIQTSFLLFIWFGKEYSQKSRSNFQNICKLFRFDSQISFPTPLINSYIQFIPEDEEDPWTGDGKSLTTIIRGQFDFRNLTNEEKAPGLKTLRQCLNGETTFSDDVVLMLARNQYIFEQEKRVKTFCLFYRFADIGGEDVPTKPKKRVSATANSQDEWFGAPEDVNKRASLINKLIPKKSSSNP